jgi:cell division protein FtsI (penicillin-binding protein 3)
VASNSANSVAKPRLYWMGGLLLLWVCAICARLMYLQIFAYGEFQARAQHQQQRAFETSPIRGVVYDRNGKELAMTTAVDSFYAVSADLPDPATTASLLSRITGTDPREMLACFKTKSFCWVARKADPEVAGRIQSMNLRGVYSQKESKRFYPKKDLAAQVLGYVGMDDKGLSGVERSFNGQLRGKPGRMALSVDARRKTFARLEQEPEPGENVVLTIDEKIQYIADRELEQAMQDTHAIAGTVIVQNPRTGEILALANSPSFNPNATREIRPEKLKNHAVSDAYEPGSTFKVITIAAGLEEKVTTPQERIDCQMGSIVVAGMRIRDSKPHGILSVADVLADSSDVGAIKIALRLGEDRFYKYIRAFGVGQQTGIELPDETRGMSKPVSRWSKVSIGAISMGQEIGISPVQLVGIMSTMANDGVWVAPRIVATTTEPHQAPQTFVYQPTVERRVISPMTAAQMRQMLEGVVLHGTGKKAALVGYTSAGKTGTAQRVDPNTHAYSKTKYIASFAGFAPVNNPAVTVAVILDSPEGLHQGGQVSAPVFARIMQQILSYLNVPRDVEIAPSRQLLLASKKAAKMTEDDMADGSPDRLGSTLDSTIDMTSGDLASADAADSAPPDRNAKPTPSTPSSFELAQVVPAAIRTREPVVPPAPPRSPEPTSDMRKPDSGTVVLDVEQGGILVPSFLGKHLRAAVELAEENNLELEAVGSGVARDQNPPPGAHVAAGTRVTVHFER